MLLIFVLVVTLSCKDAGTNNETDLVEETNNEPLVSAADFKFKTPALQADFPNDPTKQQAMYDQWNINLTGFTNQGIAGNQWNATYASDITNYFNPALTGIPSGSVNVAIEWNAFPGRIGFYYPNMKQGDLYSIADTGLMVNGSMPAEITENACDPSDPNMIKFGPYGPRGFQDEYCEWAVRRNAEGKIIRIDFTCENPEYWNTLWNVDPTKVLDLYRSTLEIPAIAMEDLYVTDANGNPVIDPSTGNNLYNPLNKWNNGSGGAMHLTSTPNTIQTEIGLATSASLGRSNPGDGIEALLCCGAYGQENRNSDPQIGGSVNSITGQGFSVSLANPPGLYIQKPDDASFSRIGVPTGNANPASFWTTMRGKETISEVDGLAMPGNYILHAKFEVPEALGYTISDLTYDGKKIKWGSEIAQLINMHIIATGYASNKPKEYDCVGTPATTFPEPLQLFHQAVYNGYNTTKVPNPAKFPMTLLSNSTYIAPKVTQGATNVPMVLVVDGLNMKFGAPIIKINDTQITVNNILQLPDVTYAVPGNSYPGTYNVVQFMMNVPAGTNTGLKELSITNAGEEQSAPMKALLYITN